YVERLEAQARLGRAGLLRRARGAPLPREMAELDLLFACLVEAGLLEEDEAAGTIDQAIRRSLAPGGMASQQLGHAARLIEALRDRLTIETYGAFIHALRVARQDMQGASVPDGPGLDSMVHAMSGLQRLGTTVAGVAAEGMVRGGGWLFLDLGRRVERAQLTAHTLAIVLDQPRDRMDGTLRLLLELCDSAITYRGRYLSVLQPAPALDLVLADVSNPRALAYQFSQAAWLLHQAGDAELAAAATGLLHRVEALVGEVADAADPVSAAAALPPLLRAIAEDTAALSDRITRRFFALLPALQSVGLEVA
ncbi:MAG: alpha-E domain-containing protein, partial [Gemmatimonadaceae bacterium]|nr:alpha-E domain-containing protein [Acetobacteraceae bacterium]